MDEQRAELYYDLIDQLLRCPNGEEPNVLDAHMDLIDEGLVKVMMQVSMKYAHEGNQDGAKFLVFVARELSKQLGLYPETENAEAAPEAT